MKVSYCSLCKGRLWQLKRTLYANLYSLNDIDAEWIILDYNCPDNISDWLLQNRIAKRYIANGKLKIYKLDIEVPFDIPTGKNLACSLATGEYTFSLDIDNFIGSSFSQICKLGGLDFLAYDEGNRVDGTWGRICCRTTDFRALGGFNLVYTGSAVHDVDFIYRLKKYGRTAVPEQLMTPPITNPKTETTKYLTNKDWVAMDAAHLVTFEAIKQSGVLGANSSGMCTNFDTDLSKHLKR
jgi:hypothetical protein